VRSPWRNAAIAAFRRVAARVERDIAFGVEHHRAVVQVRAADDEAFVVDDHQLAVHVDELVRADAADRRRVHRITAVTVGALHQLVQPRAHHAHRRVLQPAGLPFGADHRDIRALGGLETLGQRVADSAGGEVLVLQVDALACGGNRLQILLLDLTHGGASVVRGFGQRDAEFDVGDVGADVRRPRVGGVVGVARLRCCRGIACQRRHIDRLRRRAVPALAHQFAERLRRGAVEHCLHVVHRLVRRRVRIAPEQGVRMMRGRVPARTGQVDAAREREPVVDHDELLMMRRAERVLAIELECHVPVRAPAELVNRQPFAFECIQHREIPCEHVDAQVAPPLHQRAQKIGEPGGQAVACAGGCQLQAAIDVPADDEDRVART
jgi:hypothetical protein